MAVVALDGAVRVMGNADGTYGTALGELDRPYNMAWNPTNATLYVVDYGNQRVVSLGPDGTVSLFLDTSGISTYNYPYAVHVGASGNVWVGLSKAATVSSPNAGLIRSYNTSGTQLTTDNVDSIPTSMVTNDAESEVFYQVTGPRWADSAANGEAHYYLTVGTGFTLLGSTAGDGACATAARDSTYYYMRSGSSLRSWNISTKAGATTALVAALDKGRGSAGAFVYDGWYYGVDQLDRIAALDLDGSGGFTGTGESIFSEASYLPVRGMCGDGSGGMFISVGPLLNASATDMANGNAIYRLIRQAEHSLIRRP